MGKPVRCKKCGAVLNRKQKYCTNCGTKKDKKFIVRILLSFIILFFLCAISLSIKYSYNADSYVIGEDGQNYFKEEYSNLIISRSASYSLVFSIIYSIYKSKSWKSYKELNINEIFYRVLYCVFVVVVTFVSIFSFLAIMVSDVVPADYVLLFLAIWIVITVAICRIPKIKSLFRCIGDFFISFISIPKSIFNQIRNYAYSDAPTIEPYFEESQIQEEEPVIQEVISQEQEYSKNISAEHELSAEEQEAIEKYQEECRLAEAARRAEELRLCEETRRKREETSKEDDRKYYTEVAKYDLQKMQIIIAEIKSASSVSVFCNQYSTLCELEKELLGFVDKYNIDPSIADPVDFVELKRNIDSTVNSLIERCVKKCIYHGSANTEALQKSILEFQRNPVIRDLMSQSNKDIVDKIMSMIDDAISLDKETVQARKIYDIPGIFEKRKELENKKFEKPVLIDLIDKMNGIDFEFLCADLLRKNGYMNVSVTPGSGDQGVDVLAEKDGVKYAIQCKCYTSDLGNTPVQEVYAGKSFYGCHVGVVMTNRHFTAGAKDLAAATGVMLWDRDKLQEFISASN